MESLLKKDGFEFVDLFRIMKENRWNSRLFYYDGEHYSPQGNRLVAEVLFDELKRRGLESPPANAHAATKP